jgi:antitoxin (DNA-binding transcriptional repressor) of toxin-antitoxin stability system
VTDFAVHRETRETSFCARRGHAIVRRMTVEDIEKWLDCRPINWRVFALGSRKFEAARFDQQPKQGWAQYWCRLFNDGEIWHDESMTTITLQKAQQDLAVLVKRALAGEEIVIEADDRQVRLSPVPAPPGFDEATARRRGYGVLQGKLLVGPEFFDPLSDDECGLASARRGGAAGHNRSGVRGVRRQGHMVGAA